MKSIFWKEYFEHRFHFLIMFLFGIAAILVMKHFQSLDSSTLVFVLFIFACPPFTLMVAMNLVETENSRGTFPFYASLPISRAKLWLAKGLFGVGFCAALYLAYSLLSVLVGASVFGMNSFDLNRKVLPAIPFGLVFLGIPSLFFSLGYFVTMMPGIVSLVVLGVFSIGLVGFLMSGMMYWVNIPLLILSLTFVLLSASFLAFLKGELMDSRKRILWGIGPLIAGFVLCGMGWVGLDHISEGSMHLHRPTYLSPSLNILNERQAIMSLVYEPEFWDPFQMANSARVFQMNLLNGTLQQIGRRQAWARHLSSDSRYLATVRTRWPAGWGIQQNIHLVDLLDDRKAVLVDDNGDSLGFTRENDLLYIRYYQTGSDETREICRHTPGSGTRVLFSYQQSKFKREYFLPGMDKVIFCSRDEDSEIVMLDAGTGEVKKIGTHGFLRPKFPVGDKFLVDAGSGKNHGQYMLLSKEGALEPAAWISSATEFLEKEGGEKVLAVIETGKGEKGVRVVDLVWVDFVGKKCDPIKTIPNLIDYGEPLCLDKSRKFLLMELRHSYDFERHVLNLDTGELRKVDQPFSMFREAVSYGPNQFLVNSNNSLWTMDFNKNEYREILKF